MQRRNELYEGGAEIALAIAYRLLSSLEILMSLKANQDGIFGRAPRHMDTLDERCPSRTVLEERRIRLERQDFRMTEFRMTRVRARIFIHASRCS